MSIGIKDIAGACGLSINTVSDILNRGRQHLYRPDTREKVIRIAAEMNYRPNRSAQSMRSQHTRVVGFLAANMMAEGILFNHSVYPFLIGMSHYFTERRYHVSLVEVAELEMATSEPRSSLPDFLHERFLDGLVVHFGVPESVREMLLQFEIPLIWWDTGNFKPQDCIYRDEPAVARTLLDHFFALGHTRIAMLVDHDALRKYESGVLGHFSFQQRYDTFRETMLARGLEPLQVIGYDGGSIAQQLDAQDITALLVGSVQLQSLLAPCGRLGWEIPRDLSIGSFDIESRDYWASLRLSGMGYDRYDYGRRAAQMLHAKIDAPAEPAPSQVIRAEFIDGHSTAPPRSLR